MKKLPIFCSFILALYSCSQNGNTTQNDQINDSIAQNDSTQVIETIPSEVENDNKFIITNNSIGLFNANSNWKEAYKQYDYNKATGEECVDACCVGTIVLWKSGESKNNPSVVLYNKEFIDTKTDNEIKMNCEEYEKVFASRDDLFFICSDNCPSWYYKDIITGFAVYSPEFKTKENIGVGSSVQDFLQAFDKVYLSVGWIEEDADAIQLSVDKYPNLVFIVNSDSYNQEWEPANEDKIGEEYNYKILLHNTECFIGKATIQKIFVR